MIIKISLITIIMLIRILLYIYIGYYNIYIYVGYYNIYILYIHMSSTSYDVVSDVTSHPSNIYVYTCIVSCCLWIFSTIGLQQWKRRYMYNGQKLVMFIPKSFKLIILVIWIVVWPSCRCITLTMARLKVYIQIHYIQDGLGCNVPMSLKVGKCRSSNGYRQFWKPQPTVWPLSWHIVKQQTTNWNFIPHESVQKNWVCLKVRYMIYHISPNLMVKNLIFPMKISTNIFFQKSNEIMTRRHHDGREGKAQMTEKNQVGELLNIPFTIYLEVWESCPIP